MNRASAKADVKRDQARAKNSGVEDGRKSTTTRLSAESGERVALGAETSSDVRSMSEPTVEPESPRSGTSAPPFLVAAVGASAGGLVAFSGLLRHMPENVPLALVLVQHLSPDHRSMLPELLGAAGTMKVQSGVDGLVIQPNHVYVIPPNSHMTVVDGHLRVRPRPLQRSGVEGPVDALFRSVASHYKERAVGVVLSGSANDGAAGIREIKEVGGITIAQAPEEAEIDGMPRSAIATGAVDVVLPVGEIAEQLVRLSAHPFFRQEGGALEVELEHPSAATERRRIFHLLRGATGVDFDKYKTPTIARRIQRRMALHRMSSLTDYVARIEGDAQELERLQEDLLVHVTSFFRDPHCFLALTQAIGKDMGGRDDAWFRAWVPGCSTGEEAYSLAIALIELFGEGTAPQVQIFATDVSDITIDRARAGIYAANIAADLSPERLRRFFTPFDGGFRINKSVRDCCVFARQDVTRDPPFSRLDLVVCRNLLIYLTQTTQRKLMSIFHYALKPEAMLMLGRSETIGSNPDLFAVLDKKCQLYTRKPGRAQPTIEFASPHLGSPVMLPAKVDHKALHGVEAWDPQADANRFLLERYAPPAVIVDASLRVARSRGRTGVYLELPSGEASFDILRMVRPELLFGLRALLQAARQKGKAVSRDGLRFEVDGVMRAVNLHVAPLGTPERRQFLVLFEEPERGAGGAKSGARPRKPRGAAPKLALVELQQELVQTRQQLQAIIDDLAAANEELQSANEEILSSNEELQSTNEELDTAKEELQSTNEELSTVNDELQGRNEELSRANSDLLNLLASVQIPIVMVGADLRIRRFTPAAEKTLNIIPSDVGRPISHIKPTFASPDLESLIAEVVETVSIREREVETRDGRLLTLQVRPYRTSENQVDGALLVLFDISVARDAAAGLKVARLMVEAIASAVSEPILQLDGDLKVERANRAFCERFQVSRAAVQGRSIYEIDGGEWDIPSLHRLIEELAPENGSVDGFLAEHVFSRTGHRRLLIDARHIAADAQRAATTLLIFRNDPR